MSTSLGRLVLDMAANSAGFERDMQRISKSSQRELNKVSRQLRFAQRDLDQARAKVNRLAGAVTALGAIALGGLVREFRKMSQEADRIQKLGVATGLTAEAIQELGFAAEQSGSNLEGLVKGVQQMQKNIVQARDGLATYTRAFERVGIAVKDLDGLNAEQQFLALAEAISKVEDPTERTATAMELLGRAGKDLIPLLNRGSAGVEELREQMRRTGSVMSQETVDATAKFNDALNVLGKQLSAIKVQLFSDLIEPLSEFADWLANTEEGQRVFNESLERIGKTAKNLGIVIAGAFTANLVAAIGTMVVAEVRVARLTAAKLGLQGATMRASAAVAIFGRTVSIATGPIGIAIAVLGTLYLGYRSVKDIAEEAGVSMENFGRGAESTAERVARLTGNMEKLNEIQRRSRFDELRHDALELRRTIIELDQEIAQRRQEEVASGFLDPFLEDIRAKRESMLAELNLIVDGLNEMNEANNTVADSTSDVGDAAEETDKKFGSLLEQVEAVTGSIHEGIEAPQRYADAMVNLAASLMQAATGMRILNSEQRKSGQGGGLPGAQVKQYLSLLQDVKDEMHEISAIEWGFENLIDSFNPLAQEMRSLGDAVALVNERIENGGMSEMSGMFMKAGMAANAMFGAMIQGVDRTSSEYRKLEQAQKIVNVAMGIAAILQQGMGDPYTAIPRMAAVAAMVASLGVQTGSIGGGGAAQRRQDTQGTGTVLGDMEAKSESISKAIEITADATSKLVGINRGMLRTLQAMQAAIAGASGMIARGAGMFDASGINLGMSSLESAFKTFDPLGYAIDSFVGGLFGFGKTKIKDQGIALIGGLITDMTEGAVAQAFADLKRKSLFGSKSKTVFEDLDDAFNAQLNLIFESMIATVTSAGEALGIPLGELEARIAQFEVQAQEISLMDLSAEEQQSELEAVFSAIFDDFASHVIPFIDQFQKVGEGMGETLIRVATSVQVAQEAMRRLGLSIEGLGPEQAAQVSVGLMEAAGGIEAFIGKMENFVSKFAPEAHKFDIAQSDITRALENMGLSLPATRDGFWDLLQTLDPLTEEGQKAIAALLGLADAADLYYSSLEDVQREREGLERRWLGLMGETAALRATELEGLDESNRRLQQRIWLLEDEIALADLMDEVGMAFLQAVSPAVASLKQLIDRWADMEEAATELGASEEQLARVRRAARAELARWISDMTLSTLQLAEDFFSVDKAFSDVGSSVTSTVGNMRDQALRALGSIDDWLMRSQLSSISPLTPTERLGEAESQFMSAFAAAMGGDFGALSDLPGLADAFLGEAGGFHGTSTAAFRDIWDMVQGMMNEAAGIEPPAEMLPPNAGQIDTLIETNSRFADQIDALNREMQAWQLADKINALAIAQETTPAEIAAALGFTDQDMRQILSALGADIPLGTEISLRDHFNDVIGEIANQNPIVKAMEKTTSDLAATMIHIGTAIEHNLWAIGDVLVQILAQLGGEFVPSFATGGPVEHTGLANVHAGEYVVPRGGTLVSDGQDFTEVKQELNRISRLMERGNNDRRDGLGAVVREGQSTRRAIERKTETVRVA